MSSLGKMALAFFEPVAVVFGFCYFELKSIVGSENRLGEHAHLYLFRRGVHLSIVKRCIELKRFVLTREAFLQEVKQTFFWSFV